jgi:predicted GNAT family N-acyltransferase
MRDKGFRVRIADWHRDRAELSQVRHKVFIEEQGVPEELEGDEWDDKALHLLALDADNHAIGTARLLPTGQIGRMAVLKDWRGHGVGAARLTALLEAALAGDYPPLFLNAQLTALSFYERRGFVAEGAEFLDAGIPHRRMRRANG